MAITAIQSEFPNVMFVAEGDGLGPCVMRLGHIGCLIHDVYGVAQNRNQDYRAVNTDARDGIRAAVKDLCHTCRPRGTLRGVQSGRSQRLSAGRNFGLNLLRETAPSTSEGGSDPAGLPLAIGFLIRRIVT